jgi:hypothetical protein
MLFLPKMALLHQGSYCLPIAIFALFSTWLELSSPRTILAVTMLQIASFVATWAVAGDQVDGPMNYTAVAFAIFAIVAMAAVVIGENRASARLIGPSFGGRPNHPPIPILILPVGPEIATPAPLPS